MHDQNSADKTHVSAMAEQCFQQAGFTRSMEGDTARTADPALAETE